MRNWLLLGFLAGTALLAGCATVTKTPEENVAYTNQIIDLNVRQMADDWNLIWMANRQCRLSPWLTR